MRFAVIDLGTNTFNLLIAESIENNQFNIILNTKEVVKLGEGGINQKFINEAAIQRGLSTISRHFDKIHTYGVDKVQAFATSAIRDASNGQEFIDTLKQTFNLDVNIISGDTEAELIYLGVKQTLPFSGKRFLLLDIGGGSNEFIIADDTQIFWKKSFKLGMARLLDRFKPSDPITIEEIIRVEAYLDGELAELYEQLKLLKPDIFIGASGSFDSFVSMLSIRGLLQHRNGDIFHQIPISAYHSLHKILIESTKQQRDQMTELEPVRRDMIVLASMFVTFVLEKSGLTTLYQSAYSLKEGAIFEMVNNRL